MTARISVDGAREGALEAGDMGAAVHGVDAVSVAQDGLVVAIVMLHRDLDADVFLGVFEVDRHKVESLAGRVELLNVSRDASLEVEGVGFAGALILDDDGKALVEVGKFLEAPGDGLVAEFHTVEDGSVGLEFHKSARRSGCANYLKLGRRQAALVTLEVFVAVARNRYFEPLGKGIGTGDADAVKAAGDFVGAAAELGTCVQLGHNDLDRRALELGMDIYGDTAAVVLDRSDIVLVDSDDN